MKRLAELLSIFWTLNGWNDWDAEQDLDSHV